MFALEGKLTLKQAVEGLVVEDKVFVPCVRMGRAELIVSDGADAITSTAAMVSPRRWFW